MMRFLLFIIIVLDILLYVLAVNVLGFWTALLVAIATSVIGVILLINQGRRTISRFIDDLTRGQKPSHEWIDEIALCLAAFLLAFPGYLTDIIGVVILIPGFRNYLYRSLLGSFTPIHKIRSSARQMSFDETGEVIEGDAYIVEPPPNKDAN